ncbi:MAG TPA: amino acid permease [Vicinamibacteria bacterium]|nr:amino acid permease [Vicinamibacteria bacterium]
MHSPGLRRRVGLLPTASLVVGGTVGVGIFLTPAGMARGLASPALVLAVWLVMGSAAVCGALSIGELAARFPQAGGNYVYLREAFSPGVAFLYGWKCLLVMDPGLTAALATGAAAYASAAFPALPPLPLALAAIALGALSNAAGVRRAAAVGQVLAVAKIALLALLVGWTFLSGAGQTANLLPFTARREGAPALLPAVAGRWWRRSSRSAAGGRRPSSPAR